MNDMEMLRQQLAEARGQAADWKSKHDALASGTIIPNADAIIESQTDLIAMSEDLVRYGRHLDHCSGHDKCDCGFYEVYTRAWEVVHAEDDSTGTA